MKKEMIQIQRHIGVLGGGISGLATAYYLSLNPKNKVYLIESSNKFGTFLKSSSLKE